MMTDCICSGNCNLLFECRSKFLPKSGDSLLVQLSKQHCLAFLIFCKRDAAQSKL